MAQGQVSGQCFQDLDGDGEQDPGEPGVVCTAVLASDPVTIVSNSNGFYSFSDVSPGDHTVSTTLPAGFVHWSAPERVVSVAPGGSASSDFSCQRERTVSGRVFNDADGNGVQDSGESGLGGVVISLINGGTITTITTGDGSYSFNVVAGGFYTVKETDPQGYTSSTSNEEMVSIPAGGSATVNFGDQAIGTVSGCVFDDRNGDGIKGGDEAGIGGVTVTLKTDDTLVEATTTAGNGAFIFTQVGEGSFTVEEDDPEGFVSTTPNEETISLSAEKPSASVNFGDQLAGSVSGMVFRDANGDGVQNAGEAGMAGVVITLSGTSQITTTTAGDGSYLFSGAPAGFYTVEEADPEGFASTTSNTVAVSLSVEKPSASVNFGDLPIGTVSGLVFNDVNENRLQDVGEKGIGGVTITLSTPEGDLIAARKTVGDGTYLFREVSPGEYFVEETNPAGFSSTTPDRERVTVPIGGGATANFGDRIGLEYKLYLPIVALSSQFGVTAAPK